MTPEISMESALSFGWNGFKERAGFFIGLILVSIVCIAVPYVFVFMFMERAAALSSIFMIILYAVEILLMMGWYHIALRIVDGQDVAISSLLEPMGKYVNFLIAFLIASVAAGIGFIFLIIPGIFLAVRLFPVGFVIVDSDIGPIAALSRAWELTNGRFWTIFVYALVMTVLVFLSYIPLGLGLFVTMPMTVLGYAYIYRRLSPAQSVSGQFSPQPNF